jgi:hypothetical protein
LKRGISFAGGTIPVLAAVVLLSVCASTPAPAFYEWRGENGRVDLRGFLQAFGDLSKNPADESFYPHDTDTGGGAVGRLLLMAGMGDRVGFEFNGYQSYTTTTRALSAAQDSAQGFLPGHPERSAALEWGQINETDRDARLGVDRLSLRFSLERLDLTLGRQPVNLATVFYFTPNDFFAPFSPQTFFRVYKPGVDAARAEIRLGELSQLSVIDVLGYDPDPSTANGWSREPAPDRSSVLARISASLLGFEWALLGGRVYDRSLIGGSLQGELAGWLGVRAEGHYAAPGPGGLDRFVKAAVDFEHRFENSMTVRLEPYYNSRGYGSVQDVKETIQTGPTMGLFQGKEYTALGLSYEFSPLLTGELLSIANWVDPSYLLAFNSVYSLSNETEFAFGVSIPVGTPPKAGEIKSEFGLMPDSVSAEIRAHF